MSSNREIIHFIRGLTVHDIAKPLYPKGHQHSPLGYVLLSALGMPDEALVALFHYYSGHRKEYQRDFLTLPFHITSKGLELPSYLSLTNILDRIASVTYALEEKEPSGLKVASVQNPFSRLPLDHPRFGVLAKDTRDELGKVFWEDLKKQFSPKRGWKAVEEDIEERFFRSKDLQIAFQRLVNDFQEFDHDKLLETLRLYMHVSGERTYPVPNDTSLARHCHLTAIFAYIVYTNLLKNTDDFLNWRVTYDSENIHVGPKAISKFTKDTRAKLSEASQIATKNLGCHLVRISFRGFQDMFENAPRLDDLLGIRELVETPEDLGDPFLVKKPNRAEQWSLKAAFKMAIADILGVRELWAQLPLSEGLFDLIYLLPDCYPEERLKEWAFNAYKTAFETVVVKRLLPAMDSDFNVDNLRQRLKYHDKVSEIVAQLQAVPLGVAVETIEPPTNIRNWKGWARDFANKVLLAYQGVQGDIPMADAQIAEITDELVKSSLKEEPHVGEVCEVCGANPLYEEFNALLLKEAVTEKERAMQEHLKKVVREFRDRPERPCISCVAIRLMSHSVVRIKALDSMIVDAGRGEVTVREPEEGFLGLPPLMRRGTFPLNEGQYEELEAAFVRRKDGKIQRFPTISYAADRNSNVALINLRPLPERLTSEYDFTEAMKIAVLQGNLTNQGLDLQHFEKYYKSLISDKGPIGEEAKIAKPHIARVFQRISVLQDFYNQLQDDLERAPEFLEDMRGGIHTLPIQMRYPEAIFAVPADRLLDALTVLHASLSTRLFSSQMYKLPSGFEGERWKAWQEGSLTLLKAALPKLLYGAIVVFKHKQPLYVIMAAAQNMLDELDRLNQEGKLGDWRGILFGFADLRGVMSEREWVQARSPFIEVYRVIDACDEVDRRSLLSTNALLLGEELPEAKGEKLPKIAGASLYLRGSKQGWDEATLGLLQENRYFKPMVFLKRMAR